MSRRKITDDERALWGRVTKDVRVLGAPRDVASQPPSPVKKALLSSASTPLAPSPAFVAKAPRAKPPVSSNRPVYGGGDPKRDRLAARGRLPIERTLDLHGLTQAAAETRVGAFIVQAYADGCRCVLVVTGKGPPDRATAGDGRGVLRRRFLEWIEDPRFKSMIARVSGAKQRDGGAGAFYVFLKASARLR